MEENEVLEPQYGFWEVQIVVSQEDENGKIKKTKEVHLVDAQDPQQLQQKVLEEMKGTMWEWNIDSCKKSRVTVIY